jgi:hypothetical protein
VEEELRTQRALTIGVMIGAAFLGALLVSIEPDHDARSVAVAAASDHAVVTSPPSAPSSTTGATLPTGTAPSTTAVATTTTAATAAGAAGAAGPDPGALPQTDERPTASGPTFTAGVGALWEAIRQDKPELGYPFFFPERAYLQVKDISDPAGDYQHRLIANFDDDVHTLHAQLGPDAANAKLVGITVPDDQAVFVQPGEEYNKGSYWRVYGTTMQYEVDGQTGAFPVTSLISWRGQWYVVHLGAIR